MENLLSFLSISFCGFVIVALMTKVYFKLTAGQCKSTMRMDNKTVIITGGSTGIGLETARDLARRGARVILAVRSLERGESAAKDIMETTASSQVIVKECDLSRLKSIRIFCQDIIDSGERIDVLILNAGMVPPPGKYLTEDSLELQFASNHLGHFLLTNLLRQRLMECSPSRVVIVSSVLHFFGKIDFDNLSFEKYTPDPFFTYSMSKLCNLLFSKQLSRQLEGSGVTVNALHPGLVATSINRQTPWYVKNLFQPLTWFWAKSPTEGAQTSIYLAVSEEVQGVSGRYFTDCKEAACSASANDLRLAQNVWQVSHFLTTSYSDRKEYSWARVKTPLPSSKITANEIYCKSSLPLNYYSQEEEIHYKCSEKKRMIDLLLLSRDYVRMQVSLYNGIIVSW